MGGRLRRLVGDLAGLKAWVQLPQHLPIPPPRPQGCTMAHCSQQPPSALHRAQSEGSSRTLFLLLAAMGPWASNLLLGPRCLLCKPRRVDGVGARMAGCLERLRLPQETRVPQGHPPSPQVLEREPSGAGWVLHTGLLSLQATTHAPEGQVPNEYRRDGMH